MTQTIEHSQTYPPDEGSYVVEPDVVAVHEPGADSGRHPESAHDDTMQGAPEVTAPPTLRTVLGHRAVHASIEAAEAVIAERPDTDEAEARKAAAVSEAREHLGLLAGAGRAKAGRVEFEVDGMPEWLQEATGGVGIKPIDRLRAMTAIDADGRPKVGDDTMLNYLEWHNNRIAEKQAQFERDVIGPMRQRYVARFQAAIDKGWLPADSLTEDRLDKIMHTPVQLHDGLGEDDHFNNGGLANAYATAQADEKIVAYSRESANARLKKVEKTFVHEMTHIITGRTEPRQPGIDDEGNFDIALYLQDTSRRYSDQQATYGVERILDHKSDVGNELNEAVTEHLALSLLDGDIDKVTVFRRSDSYNTGRYLLNKLAKSGKEPVSPRLFVAAMLDDKAGNPAVKELREALGRAYPGANLEDELNDQGQGGLISHMTFRGVQKTIKRLRQGSSAKMAA